MSVGSQRDNNNTIMQQINNFSLTPMNDSLAEKTIEDHKYLLELVENRCAIAFFAVINRNQSLYNAMQQYTLGTKKDDESNMSAEVLDPLDLIFLKMMEEFDFMTVVMYEELKYRREFIHDCWIIAKSKDNDELKMAIINDPHFYLTREDLLILLKTNDHILITRILKHGCHLHVQEDISYKLIQIKHQQVDKNQHTPVQLLDFLSVMISNKREDNFDVKSNVLFSHHKILNFLKEHERFVKEDQVVKILISQRKFRLTLELMQQLKIPFQIEFFIQAIEANAYEIAFYLLSLHEEEILSHATEAVETHVRSYLLNKQFLKAKLHMSKCLLVVFNFNVAKQFLNIVSQQISDGTLDGNFFAHSNNPLLNMCLLYELLLNLI